MFVTLVLLVLSACTDEHEPTNRPPVLTLHEAQDITRTSATLSGMVSVPQGSRVEICRFYYGTSSSQTICAEVPLTSEYVSTRLDSLTPGTTYQYYLEAGSGAYLVTTQPLTFQTLPNVKPTLKAVQFTGKGPTSVMLRCALADDGGTALTHQGFLYAESGKTEETEISAEWEDSVMQVRILGLKENTRYTLRAFAENELGRAYSETVEFETDHAFHIYEPGTLPLLTEDDIYAYKNIAIVGPLNGTDIKLLRMMAGADDQEQATPGILSVLDLTDASIVEGGEPYHFSRFTENDVVGFAMFRGCTSLTVLKLPYSIKQIEADAFTDCTSLKQLVLAENVEKLVPSAGCIALKDIEVSASNTHYSSVQGVLYNKEETHLLWYPLGKDEEELVLSSSLLKLGEFALQECKAKRVVLPDLLEELGRGVFFQAALVEAEIPPRVTNLPEAAFQECTALRTVVLGESVARVSAYCFSGCTSLTSLQLKSTLPPVCDDTAFDSETFGRCVLIVPKGTKQNYHNHSFWKRFQHICEATD